MINNISTSNLEVKAKEFNEVFQEQYYPWFAQYMVMKRYLSPSLYLFSFNATTPSQILKACAKYYRASIEPNFQDLYLKFFDKVNSKLLNKEIVKATYENCKVMHYLFLFSSLLSVSC
jgi:CCR4-NOT transcription complex subunit 1